MEIGQSLTIPVTGAGHIPSFKNCKRIVGKRLVLDPKVKDRLARITRVIESHIASLFQTVASETQTEQSLQSWIVSSLPLDDSGDWLPESGGYVIEKVPKGEEGIIITIERIA